MNYIHAIKDWIARRSMFSLLLLATIVSTAALCFVIVFAMQRVADEHPRRYLSKVLYNSFAAEVARRPEKVEIDGIALERILLADAATSGYSDLFMAARRDKDKIAVARTGDHYIAGSIQGDYFVVLPQFGEPISTFAIILIITIIVTTAIVITGIYFIMRTLTRPFTALSTGISHLEGGDLNYQIPLKHTFGEFRTIVGGFNTMVDRLRRIYEARRHMLLALPHELLTPLSRLKVRKDLVEDEKLRSQIANDIINVEKILKSILAAERRQAGETNAEYMDIKAFTEDLIAPYKDEGTPIVIENLTGVEKFYADRFLVGVLITNFLTNAIRYGQNKEVLIRYQRDTQNATTMLISVKDEGIGIAPDQIIFMTEPFWRADVSRGRASGGQGLGLYLCKMIAEDLGGTIKIKSELNVGTCISVTIPGALERNRF